MSSANREGEKAKLEVKMTRCGINLKMLKQALRHVDDGDGCLALKEFQRLYNEVFPQMNWSEATYRETEAMFACIDADGSGAVSWEEIVAYLERSRRIVAKGTPPKDLKGMVFRLVGARNVPTYADDGSTAARAANAYWLVSSLVTFFSYGLAVWVSLPDNHYAIHENKGDPYPNDLLFALETECILFFAMETVLYVWSFPNKRVRVQIGAGGPIYTGVNRDEYEDRFTPEERAQAVVVDESKFFKLVRDLYLWVNVCVIVPYVVLAGAHFWLETVPEGMFHVFQLVKCARIVRFLWLTTREVTLASALWEQRMDLLYMLILILVVTCVGASWAFFLETGHEAYFDSGSGEWMRHADSEYIDNGLSLAMQSVPEAMWWSLVTLTTVGYGDKYCVTHGGRLVTVVVMLSGLLIFTYSMYTLTSTFARKAAEEQETRSRNACAREFYVGMKKLLDNTTRTQSAGTVSPLTGCLTAPDILSPGFGDMAATPLQFADAAKGLQSLLTHLDSHEKRLEAKITALDWKVAALQAGRSGASVAASSQPPPPPPPQTAGVRERRAHTRRAQRRPVKLAPTPLVVGGDQHLPDGVPLSSSQRVAAEGASESRPEHRYSPANVDPEPELFFQKSSADVSTPAGPGPGEWDPHTHGLDPGSAAQALPEATQGRPKQAQRHQDPTVELPPDVLQVGSEPSAFRREEAESPGYDCYSWQ